MSTDGSTPKTARERVYRALRTAILSAYFSEGEQLREAALAKDLGVSRTPVREALIQLGNEGLVEIQPHRGAIIRGLSEAEVGHVGYVRTVLEVAAVRLAAELATDENLQAVQTCLDRMTELARQGNSQELKAEGRKFHHLVAVASGNPVLVEQLASLNERVSRITAASLTRSERLDEVIKEHRAIFEAIQSRDPDAAAAAAERHMNGVVTMSRKVLNAYRSQRLSLKNFFE